jgi:hypothetical protein
MHRDSESPTPTGRAYQAPNTRVQRTRSSPSAPHSPLTRRPLGAAVKSVGRACGESLVLRVRSRASLHRQLLTYRRPGPVGFWCREPVEQQTQQGVSSARGNR